MISPSNHCVSLLESLGQESFSLEHPESWGDDYPACNGRKQSPIDLTAPFEEVMLDEPPVKFVKTDEDDSDSTMINTGHSSI